MKDEIFYLKHTQWLFLMPWLDVLLAGVGSAGCSAGGAHSHTRGFGDTQGHSERNSHLMLQMKAAGRRELQGAVPWPLPCLQPHPQESLGLVEQAGSSSRALCPQLTPLCSPTAVSLLPIPGAAPAPRLNPRPCVCVSTASSHPDLALGCAGQLCFSGAAYFRAQQWM